MLIKFNKQVTAVSSAISFNTDVFRGICHRIFVEPATATTTYDITITDENGVVIYSDDGLKGKINDSTPQSMSGIYTVAIATASADELFTFQFEVEQMVL